MHESESTDVTIYVNRSYFTDQLFKLSVVKNDTYPDFVYNLFFSYVFDSMRRKCEVKDRLLIPFIEHFKYLCGRFEQIPHNYNLSTLVVGEDKLILKFKDTLPIVPDLSKVSGTHMFNHIAEFTESGINLVQKPGVYILSVKGNETCYVGESLWLARRLGEHKSDLKLGTHKVPRLQEDFNKSDSKEFSLQVFVIELDDKAQAQKLELEIIRYLLRIGDLYNHKLPSLLGDDTTLITRNDRGALTLSKETIEKMTLVRRGKRLTDEHLRNSVLSKAKAIMADGVWYESATECSRQLNLVQSTVTRRLSNDKFPDWYYVGGKGDPNFEDGTAYVKKRNLNGRTGRRLSINGVTYLNAIEAENSTGVNRKTVYRRCSYNPIDRPEWKDWFFIDTDD